EHYERMPNYRTLTAQEEAALRDRGLNRVTDTCIPEEKAIRQIENEIIELWKKADKAGKRMFPHEVFYELLRSGVIKNRYQIDPKGSWLIAACEKNLPIFVPGWEDSTIGNIFVAHVIMKTISTMSLMRTGLEQMEALVSWYR